MRNSRVHHDKDETRIELPVAAAVLVEALVKHAASGATPAWVPYQHLVWPDDESDDESGAAPGTAKPTLGGWHAMGQAILALANAGVVVARTDGA